VWLVDTELDKMTPDANWAPIVNHTLSSDENWNFGK